MQAVSDATVQRDCTTSIRTLRLLDGKECSRGVPEIQEVLSFNQAPTSYRQIDDSQKTEGISRITQLCVRGIRIAFMSTGEIFTNASGMNINPVAMGMVSETDIRTSVYCHMAIV